MTCTADDHDTLDPFCGGCGIPLNDPGDCDECIEGLHLHEGHPFCRCCGIGLRGQKRWTILQGIRNKICRRLSARPIADWGLSAGERGL